jgi:hypothetical protein
MNPYFTKRTTTRTTWPVGAGFWQHVFKSLSLFMVVAVGFLFIVASGGGGGGTTTGTTTTADLAAARRPARRPPPICQRIRCLLKYLQYL